MDHVQLVFVISTLDSSSDTPTIELMVMMRSQDYLQRAFRAIADYLSVSRSRCAFMDAEGELLWDAKRQRILDGNSGG